jgi:hypothetical protein
MYAQTQKPEPHNARRSCGSEFKRRRKDESSFRVEVNRDQAVTQRQMLAEWDGSTQHKRAVKHQNILQRVVASYQPGTLAVSTKAMKGLNLSQMNIVQQLHDDKKNHYTIDQARKAATAVSSTSNPYEWEVNGIGNYVTTDGGVQDVLNNFGHPTQSVVKTYEDLANRVGFDVGKNRKGPLSSSTISDLNDQFDASKPLHMGFNPFLNSAWEDNLDSYSGSKTGIPLYSVMRSNTTKDLQAELLGTTSLNDVLKQVSGRPSEVHHLLFKALHPTLATNSNNLMLTERSERESVFGPGQHELMHKVASGNDKDKFRQLLPQYENVYKAWVKGQTNVDL